MAVTFETHQKLVTQRMREWITRVLPKFPARDVIISVESGLHAGCTNTLSGPSVTIGKAAGADLQLLDEAIEDRHALLSLDRSVFGDVIRVEGRGTALTLNEQAVPGKGFSLYQPLPAKVGLGDVTLSVRSSVAPEVPAEPEDFEMRPAWVRLLPVIPLVFVFIIALDMVPGPNGTRSYEVRLQQNAPDGAAQAAADVDLLGRLYGRMKDNGLIEYLTMTQNEPGSISVSGRIPQSILPVWRSTQRWFDAESKDGHLVAQVSIAPTLSDFPAISTVKISEPQQVLFQSGRRLRVGDVVKDGWTLQSVSATQLTVVRRNETLNVTF